MKPAEEPIEIKRKKPKPPLPPKPNLQAKNSETSTDKEVKQDVKPEEKILENENIKPKRFLENESKITNGASSPFKGQPLRQKRSQSPSIRSTDSPPLLKVNQTLKETNEKKQNDNLAKEESYDSYEDEVCCSSFTSLVKSKARGFSQPYHPTKNRGRSPPPVPPKPSAQSLAQARNRVHSFGEDIPAGREGFRFADDESTESSLDYKDVIFNQGMIVGIEITPKPKLTNEEKFEMILQQFTPSLSPSPIPSLDFRSSPGPLQINYNSCQDNYDAFESVNLNSDDFTNTSPKQTSTPTKKLEKALPNTEGSFGPSDARRSWPATQRRRRTPQGLKRRAPERPPPPKRTPSPVPSSLSDDESSMLRREEHLLLTTLSRVKPPRPPPPTPPKKTIGMKILSPSTTSFRPQLNATEILSTTSNQESKRLSNQLGMNHRAATVPRPPPREKRMRRRTVELTSSTWRQSQPEIIRRRTLSLSDKDSAPSSDNELNAITLSKTITQDKKNRALKPVYSKVNKQPSSSSTASLPSFLHREPVQERNKFQFRPLPPPPAPPRLHNKRTTSNCSSPCPEIQIKEASPPSKNSECIQLNQSPTSTLSKNRTKSEICQKANSPILPSKVRTIVSSSELSDKLEKRKERTKSETRSLDDFLASHRKTKNRNCSLFYTSIDPHDTSSTDLLNVAINEGSKSLSISPMPRQNSPGHREEIEDGGHIADVDSSVNSSRQTSVERSGSSQPSFLWSSKYKNEEKSNLGHKNSANRSSVFYYDMQKEDVMEQRSNEGKGSHTRNRSRSASFVEKSVQTSPEHSAMSEQSVFTSEDQGADDSDELMNIANSLKKELSSILLRHQPGQIKKESRSPYAPHLRQLQLKQPDSDSEKSSLAGDSQGEEFKSHHMLQPKRTISGNTSSARSSEASWQGSSDESARASPSSTSPANQPKLSPEEKKKSKCFLIAREMMTTEETFVDVLKLLNVDFRGAVRRASMDHKSPIVPDEVMANLFPTLPLLQNLNENLLTDIKRRVENWEETGKISDVIVKIGPFLKLYSSYIKDFENMTSTLDESCKKYPLFAQTVKEFEMSPRCQKLALKHYLLKPVQRIPQYKLMLQEYLNNLPADSPDREDTVKALRIVSEVANHANNTMKQGDNFVKLVSIQDSLLHSHEIVKPGRVFLKEGELMKISRKEHQPRWFILFNDSMLYLTPAQGGLFRVNHELPLAGMKVSVPVQADYRNEFSIISVARSFSLAAKSSEERDDWIAVLTRAIDENALKRNSFLNSPKILSETALGMEAPVWIPDARVTMCQLCTSEFSVLFQRRHHCRACGKVVCSSCSSNRVGLKYLNYRSVRVCSACFMKLKEEYNTALQSGSEGSSSDYRRMSEQGSSGEIRGSIARSDSDVSEGSSAARFLKDQASASTGSRRRHVPSVLKEVRANDQGSDISGYLFRHTTKGWKKFWYVLKSNVLYTYKASEDVAALKSIPVLGFNVEVFDESQMGVDRSLTFKLVHQGHPDVLFHAESVGFKERWVKAMQEATVLN